MPLIVLCGLPCSGKSSCASKLAEFFENVKGFKTRILSENYLDVFDRNKLFSDSAKEKEIRSFLKSETQRYINKEEVLILDSPNYIKGYRYELYCVSKSAQTQQCTIHCDVNIDEARKLNSMRLEPERYDDVVFDGLVMRFETPDPRNRWDSPLFLVRPTAGEEIPFNDIHDALYLKKPPPPNSSTLPQPLMATNFLHELDTKTQSVVKEIMEFQKACIPGDKIKITGSNTKVDFLRTFSSIELQKLRRQFVSFARSRTDHDSSKIVTMFVDFLNNRTD